MGDDIVVPVIPDAKQREVQLQDILVVSIDDCPKCVGDAAFLKNESPRLKKMAVSVTGVRPNGALAIEGRSEVLVGDEIWEQSLTGQVRRQALAADRTISSKDIADLRIKTTMKKVVHEDADAIGVMPHPVRQVSGQDSVSPVVAVLHQKQTQLANLQQEVRQLRTETGTAQEMRIKVQMVEINMTKLRRMKTDFSTAEFGFVTADSADTLQNPVQRVDSKALVGFLNWLKENNIAKVLAEPTIVTMDGRPASVHIGGEIPVPNGPDLKTIEFKNVGTEVDVLPVAVGNNRVRLELRARISRPNDSRSLQVGASRIPAFDVSQCATAIETSFGQAAVLNGLRETRIEARKTEAGVTNVENEIALMLIVTPDLVESAAAAQRPASKTTAK
jgi:Flp pilus assembly secretin CpaC